MQRSGKEKYNQEESTMRDGFRKMRRSRQELSREESIRILKEGTSGVLALHGDDGYPYAVPISYAYDDGKLYFHGAKSGHKLDAVRSYPKASFCVIAQDKVVPEEYTTYFKSVIVFGRMRILEEAEMQVAAKKLSIKYHPHDTEQNRVHTIKEAWQRLCMMELLIEYISGKAAKEISEAFSK